jgi:dTDP-4-amino-4,6-dideoxygalactose transaminase
MIEIEERFTPVEHTRAEPIYVTRPDLPSLEEFIPYLREIWNTKVLTNGGPFHQQLEQKLCEYLGVKHIALFTNGTIGLVTALQALRISGEVITTPYSFVATAHSLLWNGIKPVFVDIDPEYGSAADRSGDHAPDHGHHARTLLRASV